MFRFLFTVHQVQPEWGQGKKYFPVQLTTSRIGSQTRSIHTLLEVPTIYIIIQYVFVLRIFVFVSTFFNQYLNEFRGVFP